MKGRKLISLVLVVAMLFTFVSVIAACNKHECQHVCPTCGKCTDKDCTDPVCADKCQGHTPAPHVCGHVCPTCGKCTDSTCTDPVCADKCPGHDVDPSKEGDFTPITQPVAGKYYMGMKCSGDVYYYLKGGMNGFYMATSSNQEDAVVVTLVADGDGWLLKQGEQYMEIEISGTHVNAVYKDAQTAGKHWSWDETYKIFTWEDGTYFYGTYGNYNTIGGGEYATHAADNYKAQLGTFVQPEPPAEAESVTLDKTGTVRLLPNNSYKLTATVLPAEASQEIDWSTSSEQTATVFNGTVRAVAQGTATITATAKGTNVSATVTVEVMDNTQKGYTQDNPLSVDEAIALMDEAGDGVEVCADDSGARYFVTGVVDEGSTISTGYIWQFTMSGSSRQISCRTMSSESALGKELADMKNGLLDGCTVVVRATLKLDDDTYAVVYDAQTSRFVSIVSCVYPALTDIVIEKADDGVTLELEQTMKLSATPVPANGSLEGLEWISSDDTKVSVNNAGVITGVAAGTAQITAKVGGVTSSQALTVTVNGASENRIVYDFTGWLTVAVDNVFRRPGVTTEMVTTHIKQWSPDNTEITSFMMTNMYLPNVNTASGVMYNATIGKAGTITIKTEHAISKVTFRIISASTSATNKFSVNGQSIEKTIEGSNTGMKDSGSDYTVEFTFDTPTNTINFEALCESGNQFAIMGITLEW